MIDVVVAADEPSVLDGLRAVIDSVDDMRVVAEVSTADDAVRLTLEHLPDVLLLDVALPGLDELEATRRIVADRAASHVHVVLLTRADLNGRLADAQRAGISGYVLHTTPPAELVTRLREIVG